MLGGVEGRAVILDDQRQYVVDNLCRQFHMPPDAFGISVANDVSHPLLDGEVQRLESILIDAVFATDGEEEASHTAHLGHLILHDDATGRRRTVLPRGAMTQEEQRQVVALNRTVGKHVDVLFQIVDHLDGRGLTVLFQIVQQPVFAEKFPATVGRDVHGLCQSIGIEQQSRVFRESDLLFLVTVVILNADGQIGLDIQQLTLAVGSNQRGGIVGGIAIGQVVGTQVEHAHEGRNKHHRFVGRCDGVVHLAHDIGCILIIACQIAEEGTCNSHVERGGHTFTGHVADDEEQFVVLDDEVVEVAAHLLGGGHRGKEIQIVAFREYGGQHAHLYVVGNGELTLQSLLAGGGGLKILDMLFERGLHILKRVAQLKQFVLRMDLRQRGIQITAGDAHRRLGKLFHRS